MRNQEKSDLRRQLRKTRGQMPAHQRRIATQKINRLLKRYIKKHQKIGIYWPMGKELRLDNFFQTALMRGAELYLPYIEPGKKRLWFTRYSNNTAQKPERIRGTAKLQIPQFSGKKIRVHQLQLLLVPIVGIDRQGYRLGQAGGFYDVSLAAMKHRTQAKTLGVGFHCQLIDQLPREAHDIALNGFVSEKEILHFTQTNYCHNVVPAQNNN